MKDVIFIDMDGTIADFVGAIERVVESPAEKCHEALEKGFYRNLKVIKGAQEAVALLEKHFDVYIATKPKNANPHCIPEKLEWIEEHFPSLRKKVFFTPNKDLLRGYALIDDHKKWSGFNGEFILFNAKEDNWNILSIEILNEYYGA